MKRTSLFFAIAFITTGFLFIADAQQGKISQQSRRQTQSPKETKPAQKVPDEVLEAIKKIATDDPVERGFGLVSLIKMGPQAAPAIPYLIGVLGDDRGILAITSEPWAGKTTPHKLAIKVLTNIGKPAVEALIPALHSTDWRLRENAADAIGYLKDETSLDPLILLLMEQRGEGSVFVRSAAARALGEIQNKRAVEPLIKALSDQEYQVKQAVGRSLEKLTGEKVGSFKEWQQWWESNKGKFNKN